MTISIFFRRSFALEHFGKGRDEDAGIGFEFTGKPTLASALIFSSDGGDVSGRVDRPQEFENADVFRRRDNFVPAGTKASTDFIGD